MRHIIIPDVQAKSGINFDYLERIGAYIAEKQPEKIICLGDFADMESLSSYDKGKKSFEGRRYTKDIDAAKKAMEKLMNPIYAVSNYSSWLPQMTMVLGNHENRINRAVETQRELEGLVSTDDLNYSEYGWDVYPFLEVRIIDGIAYSHYFISGAMGRPVGSAHLLLSKKHMSCIAGHQQGFQISTSYRADGKCITGIIAGSCYEHNLDYMGPQGNKHWRGIIVANEVKQGEFDVMPVSLSYLKRKYK